MLVLVPFGPSVTEHLQFFAETTGHPPFLVKTRDQVQQLLADEVAASLAAQLIKQDPTSRSCGPVVNALYQMMTSSTLSGISTRPNTSKGGQIILISDRTPTNTFGGAVLEEYLKNAHFLSRWHIDRIIADAADDIAADKNAKENTKPPRDVLLALERAAYNFLLKKDSTAVAVLSGLGNRDMIYVTLMCQALGLESVLQDPVTSCLETFPALPLRAELEGFVADPHLREQILQAAILKKPERLPRELATHRRFGPFVIVGSSSHWSTLGGVVAASIRKSTTRRQTARNLVDDQEPAVPKRGFWLD